MIGERRKGTICLWSSFNSKAEQPQARGFRHSGAGRNLAERRRTCRFFEIPACAGMTEESQGSNGALCLNVDDGNIQSTGGNVRPTDESTMVALVRDPRELGIDCPRRRRIRGLVVGRPGRRLCGRGTAHCDGGVRRLVATGDLVWIDLLANVLASMASTELKDSDQLRELLPGLHRLGLQRDGSRS